MKVRVVGIKPLSIQDKPDVKGVELVFEENGQAKTLSSWIPPVVATVSSWQPGQEQEIEPYSKDGKERFRLPGGGRQGGGGRGFTPDPLRDAVQASVSIAQTAWRIPDSATEYRTGPIAQAAADHMLAFVEKAIPRILKASAGSTPPLGTTAQAEKETHESPAPGAGSAPEPVADTPIAQPAPQGSKTYKFDPDKCPHHNLKDAPREGFKICEDCGRAGPARQFEKQEQLA